MAGVDVVLFEGFRGREREAGPDDAVGVEGRDEEGEAGGGDVVGQVAVGEEAAGEVEEMAALSMGFLCQVAV